MVSHICFPSKVSFWPITFPLIFCVPEVLICVLRVVVESHNHYEKIHSLKAFFPHFDYNAALGSKCNYWIWKTLGL